MGKNDRTVYQRQDGKWVHKHNTSGVVSGPYDTQEAAWNAARAQIQRDGGGELTIMGRDGKIVNKDTIAPARDPYPPKG
ncbi:MAG: DUF2188 domain-containing protein [Anaerolineae bacterium]|nr:DUF2188 domain-containing protein [Anaerolineae bacterium]